MPSSGSEVLRSLGQHYEELGDGKLRTRMQLAINESMRETEYLIVLRALAILPKRGGLAKWVADAPIYIRSKTSHHKFGTWIIQNKRGHDLKDLDRGRLSHPVWGNTENWARQEIPKGYFSGAVTENLPRMRTQILAAANSIIRGEI